MVSYQLNSSDVIHETVDDEALIIHTPSGAYFSLQGTGAYVWNSLVEGHSAAEIAARCAEGADLSAEDVLEAVERFAQELAEEHLIVPREPQGESHSLPPAPSQFAVPTMQKFTDMQELLLVDPIHEVDPQAGWPQRPGG